MRSCDRAMGGCVMRRWARGGRGTNCIRRKWSLEPSGVKTPGENGGFMSCLNSLRKKCFGCHSERSEEPLRGPHKRLRDSSRKTGAQNDGFVLFSATHKGTTHT